MKLSGRSILITGGSGFLGTHLTRRFAEVGSVVSAPTHAECDFTDRGAVDRCFAKAKPALVVHAAGFVGGIHFSRMYPGEVFLKNLQMACNIIEMAHKYKVEKLVNVGSACVYSDQLEGPFPETEMLSLPMHPSVQYYGFSKQALYFGGVAFNQQFGMQSIHLIPANLYGPGDKFDPELSHVISSLIPKFYHAAQNGEPEVVCWGTGSTIREFLYVDDCAEAIVVASERYDSIEPLNVGVGEGITIRQLAETIKTATGFQGKIVWDTTKPDGAGYKVLDVSRMRTELGWAPSTTFEIGLQKTVDGFAEQYSDWVECFYGAGLDRTNAR